MAQKRCQVFYINDRSCREDNGGIEVARGDLYPTAVRGLASALLLRVQWLEKVRIILEEPEFNP